MVTETFVRFRELAEDLEYAGLIWAPEIGDEISLRAKRESVSILVDPQGMTPHELRETFIWLPSVEQMILQFEARQTVLSHAGLDLDEHSIQYQAIIQAPEREIRSCAPTLRSALGKALRDLLLTGRVEDLH